VGEGAPRFGLSPRSVWRIVTVLVSFVAALEIALRIYNPFPFRVRGDRIVLPAHQSYTLTHEGATKLDRVTTATKNSLGFRGPEPPRDWRRWFTILTIGGSTTECLFLSDGKTWTDQLARRVAAIRSDVWINNAGLEGHSTFGHLVLLRDYVVQMRPRLALFLIGVNDMAVASARSFDRALDPGSFGAAHRALTFAADHSEIAAVGENLVRMARTHRAHLGDGELHLSETRHREIDEAASARVLADHRPFLEEYARRVDQILELCRRNGIEPVLVTQPALNGDAVDPTTGVSLATAAIEPNVNGRVAWQTMELYNDVTRKASAAAGVLLIDLAREMPKDSRFYSDWVHFTNEGAVVVGDIVFRHLEPKLAR
jgi:lysophospholipase L1-like esterase